MGCWQERSTSEELAILNTSGPRLPRVVPPQVANSVLTGDSGLSQLGSSDVLQLTQGRPKLHLVHCCPESSQVVYFQVAPCQAWSGQEPDERFPNHVSNVVLSEYVIRTILEVMI